MEGKKRDDHLNMPPNPIQRNSLKENSESRESSSLNSVLDKNRMTQVRQEIGIIASRSFRENLISEEAYEEYRQLVEGQEEHDVSAEMLESTRKFAKEHEEKAVRIHQKIETAIKAGIASETDEEFLMEKLIVENIEFVGKANEVEALVDEKLARMKLDREKYDHFANHELIKEEGCLVVGSNTKIDFPDEKEFLALTVPERRELLKKLEEALPKAEKYAEENDDENDEKLIGEYEEKLDEALEQGIIGKHTYNEFLNGFKKLDRKEKKRWNRDSEFNAQMKRYEVLWSQIRDTLQGEALDGIEGKIDSFGYTELFREFGKLKSSESGRLNAEYAGALEEYRQEGIIGRHTVAEFAGWMRAQDLSAQYSAEDELPGQMERYEELWENIGELSEKQQDFLGSKIDVWGYTELRAQYSSFKNGSAELPSESDGLSRKSISQLQSSEVKEAIVETDEMLTDEGPSKKKKFMGVLDKMFSRVSGGSFNATSFEAEVHKKAAAAKPDLKRDTKGRAADDEVNFYEIGKDAEVLEENEKAEVIDEVGFVQVASNDNDGVSRQVQVTINEEDGLHHFFSEEGKQSFRASQSGGRDDLSLAIYTDSGRTVEMELKEVRALQNYLKESEQEEKAEKKAA